MRRPIAIALLSLMLAACGSTANTKVSSVRIERPPQGSTVLVMKPDITLGALTASGMTEPRADWSASAIANLAREAEEFARTRGLKPKAIDPETVGGEGRAAQVLKLHRAVGQSIATHSYGFIPLPTKKEFDWTLGDGAVAVGAGEEAAYALFISGEGTYSTSGRVAMTVALAVLGVGLPSGGQQVLVSLVELKTGRVVWSNVVVAGSNDMRTPEGADALAKTLFQDAPL
jgi:hypothetical protein